MLRFFPASVPHPRLVPMLACIAALSVTALLGAAETTNAGTPRLRPLGEILVERIKHRMLEPDVDLAVFDEELRGLEQFLQGREHERTREIAQVRFMQAVLVVTVQRDHQQGRPLLEKLAADFAGTDLGHEILPHLQRLARECATLEQQADAVGQPAPSLRFSWCSTPWIESLEDLRGMIVVLDFWTTYEASYGHPYGQTFPALRDLVARYEGYDVIFVAVTSLQGGVHGVDEYVIDCEGDAAKEEELLRRFIHQHDVTWAVAISDESVFHPGYGITALPHTVILDDEGVVRRSGPFGALPVAERAKLLDTLLRDRGLEAPAD